MENLKSLEFFIPLKKPPTVTHQEHKVRVIKGKPVFFDPPELKAAKVLFLAYLTPMRPEEPFEGPVRLTTKWIWPCGDKHEDGEYKTTKPDTDNMVKAFKDGLIFFRSVQKVNYLCEKFFCLILTRNILESHSRGVLLIYLCI